MEVKTDVVMNRLLNCDHDIKCINRSLEYCGGSDLTLSEIGFILGISRERVRQIESSALKKLRHPETGRRLRLYMES